ncbi:MAG: class I adenylate-forming enzyme family protein [Streptosporangiaceae bacterium]
MTATYDPAAFKAVFEESFTYLAGFRRNTHRFAGKEAMIDPSTGRSWTYAELGTAVDRLAAGLAEVGVRPGDVVVYQLFNCPEFAFLYLAGQQCSAVGSPINFRLAPGEIGYILDEATPRVYLYDAELTEPVGQALELASRRPDVVVAVDPGRTGRDPLPGAMRFEELVAAGEGRAVPQPAVTIYDETTRLWTSGTTGMPKPVALNSAVEVLSAHDVIMHFPLAPGDRTLNMTPWFHRGGLYSGGPNPVFYVGAAAVPMRAFDAETCLEYVERHGLTFLIGSPTSLAMLADAQQGRPRDLSSLRGIVTMGAPLDKGACLRYQELLTPRIFNGYGTTEAFWNTFLRPMDLPDHAGTAGRACTDDDVAVVKVYGDHMAEPDDFVAKDDTEVGEVIVRSPKSGYAYPGHPDEESTYFKNGWLYIGDLATWDADEYVTIVGRKDDMILSGGENVHPVQVEEVLAQHPDVADSAVVGAPDERWGETVVAYVVPRDESLTATALDEHCKSHPMLAAYKRPRAYRLVSALPVTATGKKMHYKVKEDAASDAAAGLLERP